MEKQYQELGETALDAVQLVEEGTCTVEEALDMLIDAKKRVFSPTVKKLRKDKKTVFRMCPDKLAKGLDRFSRKK